MSSLKVIILDKDEELQVKRCQYHMQGNSDTQSKQIRAKIEIYVVFELKLDDQSYKEGYIILCHVKLWVMSA